MPINIQADVGELEGQQQRGREDGVMQPCGHGVTLGLAEQKGPKADASTTSTAIPVLTDDRRGLGRGGKAEAAHFREHVLGRQVGARARRGHDDCQKLALQRATRTRRPLLEAPRHVIGHVPDRQIDGQRVAPTPICGKIGAKGRRAP
jgi:hypothetical protein